MPGHQPQRDRGFQTPEPGSQVNRGPKKQGTSKEAANRHAPPIPLGVQTFLDRHSDLSPVGNPPRGQNSQQVGTITFQCGALSAWMHTDAQDGSGVYYHKSLFVLYSAAFILSVFSADITPAVDSHTRCWMLLLWPSMAITARQLGTRQVGTAVGQEICIPHVHTIAIIIEGSVDARHMTSRVKQEVHVSILNFISAT